MDKPAPLGITSYAGSVTCSDSHSQSDAGAVAHDPMSEAQSRGCPADVQDTAMQQWCFHELLLVDEKGAVHSCYGVTQGKVQTGCCGADELLPKLPREALQLSLIQGQCHTPLCSQAGLEQDLGHHTCQEQPEEDSNLKF